MDDSIVEFPKPKKNDDKGLFLVPPPVAKCKHLFGPFTVDHDAGKCLCNACGEEVSPYFVLKKLMEQESRWMENRERYKDEMRRLSGRSKTKCKHCGEITPISRA